ncbi:hypothetical protein CEUSTIGMA_g13461.t1 [Chlamydomonas eustigma]|uniref:R3H domain-containing protein n=1 Tax=Chlamydomonas eustigma TaxID=1157962 RepID=A0A250XSN4_9CHLO|nr:hypothetical protein CEUSTIGMA_g13461.t1 [Chlamydomonas eustigma]|eukprot:GAX86046.1 hypothetical protein CEUSTIGMA_g13461.t1 [Chlamydomonas eustigma]
MVGKKKNGKKKPSQGSKSVVSSELIFNVTLHAPTGFELTDSIFQINDADGKKELTVERPHLHDLLMEFERGIVTFPSASLSFSPTLNKDDRAYLHKMVSDKFSATLESVSVGLGQERCISIYAKGKAPKKELTPEQESQVGVLYRLTRGEGALLLLSRDEIGDMVREGKLTDAVQTLWDSKRSEVEAGQRLISCLSTDEDEGTLQVMSIDTEVSICYTVVSSASVLAAKECVRSGKPFLATGELPLCTAVRSGKLTAVRALLAAGAPVDARDSNGRTALQISRTFEQCDAEAILLQHGANDPEAKLFPLTAAAGQLSASPQKVLLASNEPAGVMRCEGANTGNLTVKDGSGVMRCEGANTGNLTVKDGSGAPGPALVSAVTPSNCGAPDVLAAVHRVDGGPAPDVLAAVHMVDGDPAPDVLAAVHRVDGDPAPDVLAAVHRVDGGPAAEHSGVDESAAAPPSSLEYMVPPHQLVAVVAETPSSPSLHDYAVLPDKAAVAEAPSSPSLHDNAVLPDKAAGAHFDQEGVESQVTMTLSLLDERDNVGAGVSVILQVQAAGDNCSMQPASPLIPAPSSRSTSTGHALSDIASSSCPEAVADLIAPCTPELISSAHAMSSLLGNQASPEDEVAELPLAGNLVSDKEAASPPPPSVTSTRSALTAREKEEEAEMLAIGSTAKMMADSFTASLDSNAAKKQQEGLYLGEQEVQVPSNGNGGVPFATEMSLLGVLPGWTSVAAAMAWAQRPSNVRVVLLGAACVFGGAMLLSWGPPRRGLPGSRGHLYRRV